MFRTLVRTTGTATVPVAGATLRALKRLHPYPSPAPAPLPLQLFRRTSANNVQNAGSYNWNCNGLNGGSNVACSEAIALPDLVAGGVVAIPAAVTAGVPANLYATVQIMVPSEPALASPICTKPLPI